MRIRILLLLACELSVRLILLERELSMQRMNMDLSP